MAQPADYSLPGVMRYLQTEWQRNERDRIQWELERAEMKTRIAKLEGEKRGLQLLVDTYTKKVKILETSLGGSSSESENGQDEEQDVSELKTNLKDLDDALNAAAQTVDVTPLVESREFLEMCIQEVEYLLQSSGNSNATVADSRGAEDEFPISPPQNGQQAPAAVQPAVSRDVHPSKIASTWTFKNTYTHSGVREVAFLSRSQLITGGAEGLRLWNLKDGSFKNFENVSSVKKLSITLNGTVFVIDSERKVTAYDVKTRTATFEAPDDFKVNAIANDNKYLACAGDEEVRIYDISKNNELLSTFTISQPAIATEFFHDGSVLVAEENGRISIHSIDTGREVIYFDTDQKLADACFSLMCQVLIVAFDDGSVAQYDPRYGVRAARPIMTGDPASGAPTRVFGSPNSRQYVACSGDDAQIWPVGPDATQDSVETLNHRGVTACHWYSANMLATCGNDIIKIYAK